MKLRRKRLSLLITPVCCASMLSQRLTRWSPIRPMRRKLRLANVGVSCPPKDALDVMCSYMPGSVRKQCTAFVDTYTAMIIDMLTKDVSPQMICSNLGLCTSEFAQVLVSVHPTSMFLGGGDGADRRSQGRRRLLHTL